MKFLVDWISLQVGELLGYGACSLFIAWSTVISGKAIFGKVIYSKANSGKTIYSKLNHIYISSGRALKMYFLFSVLSLVVHT